MASFPFVGGAYESRSPVFDAQRCVNLVPEISGSGTSRSVVALFGAPGLVPWVTLPGAPVRGLLRLDAQRAVAVAGGSVLLLDAAGASTLIGSIPPAATRVSLASNGLQVMIATGDALYAVDLVASTVQSVGYAATAVGFVDGYFVFSEASSGRLRITELNGTAIDALDFATAEGAPDNLVSLIVDHREVWLFGEDTTEVWFNSGNPDFPFERMSGAFIEHGCAAAASVAKLDNSVFWLASDDRGRGAVMRADGYSPQRISTHAIEHAMAQMPRVDDAVAWTYQSEGHAFYVLSFPAGDQTWVYDVATRMWHERAWRDADGTLHRHRAHCHMAFADAHIVGDWETGALYQLSEDALTDAGAAIARIRRCPAVADKDGRNVFFDELQLVAETGVGLDIGQGADPQAMLRFSNDSGRTWSNERWASLGPKGRFGTNVIWRRLGMCPGGGGRVFEVTVTDPVKVSFISAVLRTSKGR